MKKGFTLIEMLIAISIFSVVIIAFIGILVVVTQVQVQSTSSAAVGQESQFLLGKLQYYVETASLVNIPTSTTTSTLQLFMASSSADPTFITLASGTVYLQQSVGGPLQALTSNKVSVSNLSFVRRANPPGHDVVNVSFTMAYNTTNVLQAFSQLFQSSIEHVSAATFDTNVLPSVNGTEPLGNSSYQWISINNIINFSGGNVGINTLSPYAQLSVSGGIQLIQSATGTCGTNTRGTLWFVSGGAGKDSLWLCAQNASGTPAWQQIY
jgi:prepilin-type N-terminal cleavage/methylation domain-containing protein